MAALWKPFEGMSVKEVAEGLFLFRFYHTVDRERVLSMGPWTFNNHLLLLEKMEGYEDPKEVPLFMFSIWVQIVGLKSGFNSEHVLERIGNEMGVCLECDENNFAKAKNFSSSWNSYMWMRVKLDVRKPLWKEHYLRWKGGQWFEVEFLYKRVPNFCYICGIIGHGEKFCTRLLDMEGKPVQNFRPEMRAGSRAKQFNIGARWLRDEDGVFPVAKGGRRWRCGGARGSNDFGIPKNHGDNSGGKGGDATGANVGENNGDGDNEGESNSVFSFSSEAKKEGITINDPKRRRMGQVSNVGRSGGLAFLWKLA
uniref:CCHC-type domain-containing protein n=1 Tax=Manihot esculenta TaxID=3983 RepID=A0A2C9UR74_MANES